MSDTHTEKTIPQLEEEMLAYWKENTIFEKSVSQRPSDNSYVFYDGPPFISGLPHYGHFLASIAKDIVPRYWTMRGKRVERVWGWDAHGLTVENKVQKELGIKDRREIENFGLSKFTEACYKYTSATSAEWPWYIERIGRWVDMEHAYKTIDTSYMESVMWAFKQLYDKKLIYEGMRTSLYCTTCGTPVSNFEVAMDDTYKEVEDPAVTIKFKISTQGRFENMFVLAWTTTPWTLPSNRALVLDKSADYALVEYDMATYILAVSRVAEIFKDKQYNVIDKVKGADLVGLAYEPLYKIYANNDNDFKIYHFDNMVSADEGTGVVHSAPGFGAIDTQMGFESGLTLMTSIDDEGKFTQGNNEANPYFGLYYSKANPLITYDLEKRGLLFENSKILHRFPYHDRCNTLLIQRAQHSWFLRETEMTKALLDNAEPIKWVPDHLKNGLFKYVIESAPDWCISRNRYWATPMPVWESADGDRLVLGSIKEIEELSGQKVKDLHRPYIDEIVIHKDGKEYKRRVEVLDSWFEAGSMPFAQWHYPFENKEKFEQNFPGDYIVEYIAQTRAWFRVLHVISVGVFDTHAFKNVVCTGVLAGNDGRKMSKTYGNYTDPKEVLQTVGGDAVRLYFMNSPLLTGGGTNFDFDAMKVKSRNVINPLLNSLKFFMMYTPKDNWQPDLEKLSENVLDKWIMIRLNETIKGFSDNMENYLIADAVQYIEDFVDDLSRWYVRRSRERITSGDNDALNTLFTVLYKFSLASAPTIPFLSERIYQSLKSYVPSAKESVHLEDYPQYDADLLTDESNILVKMKNTRDVVSIILAMRSSANVNLKVRQPLQNAFVVFDETVKANEYGLFVDIVQDEVNIKEVSILDKVPVSVDTNVFASMQLDANSVVYLNKEITEDLRLEGMARDFIRAIQDLRKTKGYNISDNIDVTYPDTEEYKKLMDMFGPFIKSKVTARNFVPSTSLDVLKI